MSLFVGRRTELARLAGGLHRASRGEFTIVVIEAESGLGKSSLLDEFLRQAVTTANVLSTAAYEEDQQSPGRLLGGLRGGRRAYSVDEGVGVVESVADQIADETSRQTVVVALDDVHWADEISLAAIGGWSRRLRHLPVFLVVATRPSPRPDLARLIDRLTRAGADHLAMSPFGPDDLNELVDALYGAPPTPRLRQALVTTGGSPMFATEFLRALADDSLLVTGERTDLVRDVLPGSLRTLLLRRVAALGAPAVGLIRAAAVLGNRFPPEAAAQMNGLHPLDAMAALEHTARAGLLLPGGTQYRFRHDMIRRAVYEDLADGLRRMLHRQAAEVLSLQGASEVLVARQLAAAGPTADGSTETLDLAFRIVLRDPETARRLMAVSGRDAGPRAAALQTYVKVLRGEPLEEGDLRIETSALPPPDQVAYLIAAATHHGRRGAPAAADECFRSAIECLRTFGGEREVAVAEAQRARLATRQGWPGAKGLARAAWAEAHRLRSGTAIDFAAGAIATSALVEDLDLAAAEEALSCLDPARLRATTPTFLIAYVRALRGDVRGAAETFEAVARVAAEHHAIYKVPLHLSLAARFRTAAGDWAVAAVHREEAEEILDDLAQPPELTGVPSLGRMRMQLDQKTLPPTAVPALPGEEEMFARFDFAVVAAARDQPRAAVEALAGARRSYEGIVGLVFDGPRVVQTLIAGGAAAQAADVAESVLEVSTRLDGASAATAAAWTTALVARDYLALAGVATELDHTRPFDAALVRDHAAGVASALGHRADADRLRGQADAGLLPLRVHVVEGVVGTKASRSERPKFGWESLTATERKIAHLVARPASNGEIAAQLVVSRRTVETHVAHIFKKLGLRNRMELVAMLSRLGGAEDGMPQDP